MEIVNQQHIESKILLLRNVQVMLDKDLADLYQVETKVLNQAVKRNIDRFPDSFRFQLSESEKVELVTNCDRFQMLKHSTSLPYAFTEQGVAMLSAVLRSDIAVQVSIQIIQAFVAMRNFLLQNASVFQRLDRIEMKQLQTDEKFDKIFKALESGQPMHDKGIFFNGQVFDAYCFVSDLIKNAHTGIVLIDNFIDESVLTLLSKRKANVSATIYTKENSKAFQLDLKKHNAQYPPVDVKHFADSHDRFLIIDNKELYHIGASLKDLGKKWFAFSRLDSLVDDIMKRIVYL